MSGFFILIFYNLQIHHAIYDYSAMQSHSHAPLKRLLSLMAAILLLANGLWLLSLNSFHFGTLLPMLFGAALFIYALAYVLLQRWIRQRPIYQQGWRLVWGAFWVWLLSVALFFGYLHWQSLHSQPNPNTQAILILGGGIQHNQPTPTLAKRLNAGATLAKQLPQIPIIVSGGAAFGNQWTEAEVMAHYLTEQHHLPKTRILLEARSTSTALNFHNSKALLVQHDIQLSDPIAVVTSDFHLPRALAIARKQGYQQPLPYSAPTPLYIRYNSWLREYFAYVSGWLLNEY